MKHRVAGAVLSCVGWLCACSDDAAPTNPMPAAMNAMAGAAATAPAAAAVPTSQPAAAPMGQPAGTPPATGAQPAPQPPAVDTSAPEIPGVVAGGTTVKVIKEGFQGTEGPLGMKDGSLIFTETVANRISRIADDGSVSTFLENTNGSNGLGFDAAERLISVQTTPGMTRVGIIYPPDSAAVLTDNFEGKPYGRPNDLIVSKQGAVYFTEPGPNPPADGSMPAPPPLTAAVYFIPAGGQVMRVAEGIARPNGIMLSRDEKTLYVNNTNGEFLLAFDVQPDGTLQNRRDFARYEQVMMNANGGVVSGADGLAIDSEGRLYAATLTGVQVFGVDGLLLGTIPFSRQPQNLAFAGPDKKTLYVVGRGAAYKVAMVAQGFSERAK